jgi:proteasome lid subunit RPN8/RPN11
VIVLPRPLRDQIVRFAEHAYPEECCGLLIGHDDGRARVTVTRVAPSRNVAEGRERDSFEVDPQLRFDLMRELNHGPDRIIGHYHSHPDNPARPSARDRAMAWEPELIWVIVSVREGRVSQVAAHLLEPLARRFREIPIRPE